MVLEQVDQCELALLAGQHRPGVLVDEQVLDLLMLHDLAEQIVDRLPDFQQVARRFNGDEANAVAVLVGDADSGLVCGEREELASVS